MELKEDVLPDRRGEHRLMLPPCPGNENDLSCLKSFRMNTGKPEPPRLLQGASGFVRVMSHAPECFSLLNAQLQNSFYSAAGCQR